MNSIIRKISVGMNYPDGCLHYQVGGVQTLKRKRYRITHITQNKGFLGLGKPSFDVYVQKEPDIAGEPTAEVLWKTIVDVPVVIENNIDF
jgi:hypothetical protein